jgi:hypothetical protein
VKVAFFEDGQENCRPTTAPTARGGYEPSGLWSRWEVG